MFADNGSVIILNYIRNAILSLAARRITGNRLAAIGLTCVMCISLTLSGCASVRGTPKPVIDVDDTLTQYTNYLKGLAPDSLNTCDKVRNGVNKALTAMDLSYAEFVDDLSIQGKTKATLIDFTLTGLGLAGTAVGGAEAKTVFSALTAGIAATNTSIDKNFLYEKTISALVAKMNADRKAQQLFIIKRLHDCKSPEDYLWSEAVHDLIDYYAAGTLLGAVAAISKDAGAKEVASQDKIEEFLNLKPSAKTPDKQWLHEYFKKSNENRDNILRCWKKVGTKRPNAFEYASDLFDEPFASDIPAVRQCLKE